MSLYKRGDIWWAAFSVDGVSYRKSTGKSIQREAKLRERELVTEAENGHLDLIRIGGRVSCIDRRSFSASNNTPMRALQGDRRRSGQPRW